MDGTIVAMHHLGIMIKPDDGSPDAYHAAPSMTDADGRVRHWKKGQRVSFTLQAPQGPGQPPRATAVLPLEKPGPGQA